MITLTKVDPARNMARFYTLDIQPTLFGEFALVREWGRIGGGSQRRGQWFATAPRCLLIAASKNRTEAQAAHDRALARRRKREYR